MKLDRSLFLKELKQKFPELRQEINRQEGLLHMEVGVFCHYTQELINSGDKDGVVNAFELARKYLQDGNSSVQNAIGVSYIESLEFKDTNKNYKSWAWELLPKEIKAEYVNFHGSYRL